MQKRIYKLLESRNLITFTTFYFLLSFGILLVPFILYMALKLVLPELTLMHNENFLVGTLSKSFFRKFITLVIIGPIIETLIFQHLIIISLLNRFKKPIVILISSFIFGISHFYDIYYIINTFFIGLVLALAYINWKGESLSSFTVVFLIHAMHNFSILFIELLI